MPIMPEIFGKHSKWETKFPETSLLKSRRNRRFQKRGILNGTGSKSEGKRKAFFLLSATKSRLKKEGFFLRAFLIILIFPPFSAEGQNLSLDYSGQTSSQDLDSAQRSFREDPLGINTAKKRKNKLSSSTGCHWRVGSGLSNAGDDNGLTVFTRCRDGTKIQMGLKSHLYFKALSARSASSGGRRFSEENNVRLMRKKTAPNGRYTVVGLIMGYTSSNPDHFINSRVISPQKLLTGPFSRRNAKDSQYETAGSPKFHTGAVFSLGRTYALGDIKRGCRRFGKDAGSCVSYFEMEGGMEVLTIDGGTARAFILTRAARPLHRFSNGAMVSLFSEVKILKEESGKPSSDLMTAVQLSSKRGFKVHVGVTKSRNPRSGSGNRGLVYSAVAEIPLGFVR